MENSALHLEQILPSCVIQPRSDTVVGAYFGRAGQGPEMDPQEGELIGREDGGGQEWVMVGERG